MAHMNWCPNCGANPSDVSNMRRLWRRRRLDLTSRKGKLPLGRYDGEGKTGIDSVVVRAVRTLTVPPLNRGAGLVSL